MSDALDGFDRTTFDADGRSRPVWRAGRGPGVVVVHEVPGITPAVAHFARMLVEAGFTVAMPELVGEAGRAPSPRYIAASLGRVCVSREMHCLALRRTSPVADWLRALARDLHRRCGGPGVGAVGMCFSGGFALAMAVDPAVVAPVISQPGLPFAVSPAHARDLGLGPDDRDAVARRAAAGECEALALRFTHDRTVPPARFAALRELLGAAVTTVEIDSGPGNPNGLGRMAHSVLTEELVDDPAHPTRRAVEQVIDLFRRRLQ